MEEINHRKINLGLIPILIAIFLFFTEISKASDLMCSDWLNGTIDPDDDTKSTDSQGIKGVCRDFFPTWGEREKVERTTTDPFEAKYTVTRQYCWARFFIDGSNKCGAPSINGWALFIPISFTWDPPAYTLWGDTKSASVPLEATIRCSSEDDITLITLFNKARICRFNPGDTFLHGGTNTGKQIQVCGYYVPWLLSGIIGRGDWSDNLIGCVNAPLLPGPPTFNSIISAGSAPYVDTSLKTSDLIALGSTFDQPLLQLKSISSTAGGGSTATNTILLKYKFDGDKSYSMPDGMEYDQQSPIPQCSIFPNVPSIKYCAKVSTDNPGVVCACASTECNKDVFLGCVPRPTPKQSNVAVVAVYSTDSDQVGNMYPAAELIFAKTRADGSVIQIDEGGNGSEVYFDAQADIFKKLDTQGNETQTPAVEPVVYVRLPLSDPNNKLLVREYYAQQMADPQDKSKVIQTLARGTGSLYGLEFMSIIPKFNADGSIKNIRVYTAQARQNDDGCCAFTTMPDNSSFPQYIAPGGTRDTTACCPSSIPAVDQMQKCAVPPYSPTCKNGSAAPARDTLAEEAVCPGGYTGPAQDDNGSQICLLNQTDWTDAVPGPICGTLPSGCDAVTVPSPSSGYTTWPQAKQNEVQTGSCDIAYGLEAITNIKIVQPDFSNLSPEDAVAAQNEYNALVATLTALKTQAESEKRNIQDSELPTLQYNQVTKTVIQPTRTCGGSVFSTIENPCVYVPQCIAITKQAPINGAALWPDSSALYKPNAEQNILGDDGTGKVYQDLETVSSSCTAPYATPAAGGSPTRQCITRYKIKDGAVQLVNQFWGAWQNACQ